MFFFPIFINIYTGSEEDTDEAERSMTLIREFIELSDAEESFLERKASIRRSLSPEDGSLDLFEEQNQTLIQPTRSLLDETYSNDYLTKDEEDEDLEHLESHLNSSISRILSKIKKLKNLSFSILQVMESSTKEIAIIMP